MRRQKEALAEEMEWSRTRELWVALMNASFKKQGGGKFQPTDLIKLSFDKNKSIQQEKPSLETFERLVQKHGKRKKKNGK
jgi:hypothetical protein